MEKLITPDFGLMFWTFVNFALLLVVLGKFAWKPILSMLEERERAVKADREAAEAAKTDAERIRAELHEKLKALSDDVKAELSAAARTGESERQEILAQAKAQAEQLLASARQDLARDRDQLKADLKKYVSDISLSAAEKVAGRGMDDKSNRDIVEQTLKDLGGK